MRERRKSTRVSLLSPLILRFPQRVPPESWGMLRNISLSGAGMESRYPIKEGDIVYLSFRLDTTFSFENVKAIVSRAQRWGAYSICGLRFASETLDSHSLKEALLFLASK